MAPTVATLASAPLAAALLLGGAALLPQPGQAAETATVVEILDGNQLYIDQKQARVKAGLRTWTGRDGTPGSTNFVKWLSRLRDDDVVTPAGTFATSVSAPAASTSFDDIEPF